MTEDEAKEVKTGLQAKRDELQQAMHEARDARVKLQLGNMDKHRDFLQKIGELSFVLGAAIAPVILATHASEKVDHLGFVIAGAALYLLNGLLALWRSKEMLERNADDAPFVGLNEEIHTYPLIHAHNKLLFDLDDETYREEYRKTSLEAVDGLNSLQPDQTRPKVSLWLDALLANFVLASLLIARAVWPQHATWVYWLIFGVALTTIAVLTVIGYMRAWKSQLLLQTKREKLAAIKAEYQEWHNTNILKN